MKKRLIAFILIVLIAGLSVFFIKSRNKIDPNELILYGNIEIRTVDLSFQVGGKIDQLFKEEGDVVEKGEAVATIDPADYRANFKKAQAEVERALSLKQDSEDKYERNAPLAIDNIVSKQDVETFLNNKNKANAEYNAAIANRDYWGNQLAYTTLYAPDDGIIMIRAQEPGSNIPQGQSVYTMAKTNPVWVKAYVNETDLGNIKYGQEVNIYTDTVNPQTEKKREYQGKIGYISPVAEFTPKTVQSTDIRTHLVYRIRVYINNTDAFLRQGMPVTIKINLKAKEDNADGNH